MIYLIDISKGLNGILLTIGIFALILLLVLKIKPIQKIFKVDEGTETIVWFGILLAYVIYKLITF